MFSIIPRALVALGFVWLMVPHQPDLGLGRPSTIETLVTQTAAKACTAHCDGVSVAMLGSVTNLENSRNALLDDIARVRSDLRANGAH